MIDEPIHPLHGGGKSKTTKPAASPAAGKAAGKASGKASGKAADKASGKAAGKASGKAADKASGKAAGKASGKAAGKASGKAAGQVVGKPRRPVRKRPTRGGRSADGAGPPAGTVRIQKVLAEAGVASRRACEALVEAGRVRVNGRVVTALPCFVKPADDKVAVDGESVALRAEAKVYLLVNKPKGVVCTSRDPAGRLPVIDLVATVAQRVFPVGRLDADSTGVILLTNDGELANRVMHPRYGLVKTYTVEVAGRVDGEMIAKLKGGMVLDGKRTSGAAVKVLRRNMTRTLLELGLREGRNREVRRMIARLGLKVRALRRVAIGSITDRGIKIGKWRRLTEREVRALWHETDPAAASGDQPAAKRTGGRKPAAKRTGGRKPAAKRTGGRKPAARPKPQARPETKRKPKGPVPQRRKRRP